MTDVERASYIKLLEAIKLDDPTLTENHRRLARAVLMVAKTENLSALSHSVLKAAAKEIAPELFD